MTTSKAAVKALIKTMTASLGVPLELRVAAAEGLGYAGGDDARKALLKMMNASLGVPKEVRLAAAKALGQASRD
ncbi:hypothetical protein AO391_03150 [Pseudomonas marginalis ICMP 9505]|nr:hypothetical protein AO391_03150 [Pseudomonas marginalis ICMP 9505]